MLGHKSKPVIGILTGSGNKSGPISHFQPKPTQSPKGLKKSFDFGAVGLGIVAALEISGDEIPANKALISRNSSRSITIPTISKRLEERMESESLEEEYTIVTRHFPNKPYTKVYGYGGVVKSNRASVFHISSVRFEDAAAGGGAPAGDFLSACHLCHKRLQGEDIYMYRGEKAFCSTGCRDREMMMDERRERCGSEASRAVDLSSSPYANGQIFTKGILAV